MDEALLTELLKLSVPTALLGWISYTLWKRFDARVKQNEQELRELRTRYDNEIFNTRGELKEILRENTSIMSDIKLQMRNSNAIMDQTRTVMKCLVEEIKHIKPQFLTPKKNT